jgi:hypothetical protein
MESLIPNYPALVMLGVFALYVFVKDFLPRLRGNGIEARLRFLENELEHRVRELESELQKLLGEWQATKQEIFRRLERLEEEQK